MAFQTDRLTKLALTHRMDHVSSPLNGLPSMLDHADLIEEQLETHVPGALSLSDDVFHRTYNRARDQLRIPLPPD